MTRRLLALTATLFALGAGPASAATFCVPSGPGCDGSSPTLQGAVNAAAAAGGRDTIRISAGYSLNENVLVGPANVVDIVGGGRGTDGTMLTNDPGARALEIQSPGSTVSNMRIALEPATGFETGLILEGDGAVADGVTVVGAAGVNNARGAIVRTGAVLRNSHFEVPASGSANYAVGAEDGTVIDNVTAAGDAMVNVNDPGAPVVIRRLRSSSPSEVGVLTRSNTQVQISDSLIRVSGGTDGAGLAAEGNTGENPSIVARHVTVIGTGALADAGIGVYAGGFGGGQGAVDVRDSLFHALSTDLFVEASAGSTARIAVAHSNYDPARVSDASAGDAAVTAGAGNVLVNPGFVDAAALDFRLRGDSPLIDRGFAGEGSTADLDGQARPNDGNGDGLAIRDIGTYEFQRAPTPPAAADTTAPLFRILSKRLTLNRRGRVALVLRGPANEVAVSRGSLGLRALRARRSLGRKSFSLAPSARKLVRVKLSRKNARRVRRKGSLRVRLSVTVRDAAGNGRTVNKRLKLRAAR